MLKKSALSILLFISSFYVFGQKKLLDTGVYRTWAQTGTASISGDGRYVAYVITNSMGSPNELVIQSTNSAWKNSFKFNSGPWLNTHIFTFDSRYAVFMKTADTLEMIDLQTKRSHELGGVKTFNIQAMGHWIDYSVIAPGKQYIFKNTLTGEQISIDSADQLEMPKRGNAVYYWVNPRTGVSDAAILYTLDLSKHQTKRLWTGTKRGNLVFSDDIQRMAFTGSTSNPAANDIWFYHVGRASKVIRIGLNRITEQQHSSLLSIDGFEQADKALSITMQKDTSTTEIKKINMVSLDIWSYTDPILQSEQSPNMQPTPAKSHALLTLDSLKLIPIADKNEAIVFKTPPYTVVGWSDSRGSVYESGVRWSPYTAKPRYYLVSNKDGKQKPLPVPSFQQMTFSLQGKYLVFVNVDGNYCSYNTATGQVINLVKNVVTDWSEIDPNYPFASNKPRYVSKFVWTQNDRSVLVYDRDDIWELDPEGKKTPINLTNGYGKRNYIRFELALNYQNNEINVGKQLILKAFNTQTKESGYFEAVLDKSADPVQLCMGTYQYFTPDNGPWIAAGAPLTKEENTGLYLVGRMSTAESPNYFVTTDFRSFKPITDIYPEKAYEWMTSELVNWKQPDGRDLQGILYKPKNFDPNKKYPVIFYYYTSLSDGLNVYQPPGPSAGSGRTDIRLNAPYYTAHDYLVFCPDIIKKTGAVGQSSCDAVVSAARYLSQRPYIDSSKLGLYGISLGSYETNYIVTHSRVFAAAFSGFGFSDIINASGELRNLKNGNSYQEYIAFGQQVMGQYLWENPQLYLENSPVVYTDRVSTPLLMMYNKADALNFVHGVAFFTALRTLGKKAWLLQYDEGGHGIDFSRHPDEAIDFDVRLKQFYDFYLKGRPAPFWMLDGIPAYLKDTKTGLELDTSGRVPGLGLPQMRAQMETNEKH